MAVLRLRSGEFGFADTNGAKLSGDQRLECELTFRDGRLVFDRNGLSRPDWTTLPADYGKTGDRRWDAISPR